MQHIVDIHIPALPQPIRYTDKIMLVGSCFTEHMSDRLASLRFRTLSNPNGILFNPLSVAGAIDGYIDSKTYNAEDLFYLNELWNSWDHHTRYSHIVQDAALAGINESQQQAGAFIKEADWLIVTLGSAFQYYIKEDGRPVSNNHRAPGQWFEKQLLSIDTITTALQNTSSKLAEINPHCHIIFTISPVRHIRDGVIDNNRSKARLIEAVHSLCETNDKAHYFPAYELVIDVLRDYRYYDIDLVHPNYAATSYVWEQFSQAHFLPEDQQLMKEVGALVTSYRHRPRFPETEAHKKFLKDQAIKAQRLMEAHPFLELGELTAYFEQEV